MKCEHCGERIGIFSAWKWVGKNKAMHVRCIREKELKKSMDDEIEKKTKMVDAGKEAIFIRELIGINNKQLVELKSIKDDIHTISIIVLIWFIIGLIGLLLSLITWVSLTNL